MIRDSLGRFARSTWFKRFVKFAVLIGFAWFVSHLFFSQYMFVHSNGIYGVISKDTYNAGIDDHAKAQAWDSMPPIYEN